MWKFHPISTHLEMVRSLSTTSKTKGGFSCNGSIGTALHSVEIPNALVAHDMVIVGQSLGTFLEFLTMSNNPMALLETLVTYFATKNAPGVIVEFSWFLCVVRDFSRFIYSIVHFSQIL